jgi:hypothetical protein
VQPKKVAVEREEISAPRLFDRFDDQRFGYRDLGSCS